VEERREPTRPGWSARWDRRCDRVRLGVIACWLLVVVALPLAGERSASWNDVQAAVGDGAVHTVRVSGELGPGTSGYGTVEIHWRDGLLRRVTTVVQVRGQGERPGESTLEDASAVLHTAPSTRLAALQPGLSVRRDDDLPGGGRLFGWAVPAVVGMVAFFLLVVGFGLLVTGPQPWRATRWAWFWLLASPVGAIAFLLLSGRTPGLPTPKDLTRRLTGGWAFLLALALIAVFPW
jgi:hypothetical protein